ncbi:MAG: LysM peptidoglycan-binding domain-containing protein [Ignavibacteriales bacterium]|nr:LysM peptidoglycan-binding domain-containing protein [Ignavibacteriales bacterium]
MKKSLPGLCNTINKRKNLLFIALYSSLGTLLAGTSPANLPEGILFPPDSIAVIQNDSSPGVSQTPTSATEGLTRLGTFPFLRTSQNFIEWQDEKAAEMFFSKLANASNKKLRILHIGDSHLQADIYTGYIREELQKMYGMGGRGIVFPYSAAKTHSAYDYFTYSKGKWLFSKNTETSPLLQIGLAGYSISTTDPNANFKLVFSKTTLKSPKNTIKIYTEKGVSMFDVVLKVNGVAEPIILTSQDDQNRTVLQATVDSDLESIEVSFKKSNDQQTAFICYGIMLESTNENGVLYASTGVNGAGLGSILRQSKFEDEIKDFNPDLFILDLGINDFFAGGYDEASMKQNLVAIVNKVKNAVPGASIMLFNIQDAFNKRNNVSACLNFAQLVKDVAFENGCLFYDIYNVSGGKNSMLSWRANYLANVDQIHLTSKGYNLKGELLLTALQNSMKRFNEGEKTLVVNNKILEGAIPGELAIYVDNNESQSVSASNTTVITGGNTTSALKDANGEFKMHKVLGGESIRSIAKLYNVEISDIREWNNFFGALSVNQELKVYTKRVKTPVTAYTKTTATQPTTTNKPVTKSYSSRNTYYGNNYGYKTTAKKTTTPVISSYSVRNGDTWYAISKRTGIPVNQLKAANGTKGDIIRPGQKIKVPQKNAYVAPKTTTKYGNKYASNKSNKNVTAKTGKTTNKNNKTTTGSSYSVKSGDTWSGLSQKTGIPVNQLKAANGVKGDIIRPGQKIKIPAKKK